MPSFFEANDPAFLTTLTKRRFFFLLLTLSTSISSSPSIGNGSNDDMSTDSLGFSPMHDSIWEGVQIIDEIGVGRRMSLPEPRPENVAKSRMTLGVGPRTSRVEPDDWRVCQPLRRHDEHLRLTIGENDEIVEGYRGVCWR